MFPHQKGTPMTTEPVALSDALKSLLLAVIAALVAFEVWQPTEAQTAAMLGLFAALNILVSAFVRRQVTPNVNVLTTKPQGG